MSLWIKTEGGNLFNLDRAALVEKRAHDVVDMPGKTHYVMARPAMTQNSLAVRLFEGTNEECDEYMEAVTNLVGISLIKDMVAAFGARR